jgi:hypothetical protein
MWYRYLVGWVVVFAAIMLYMRGWPSSSIEGWFALVISKLWTELA